MKKNLAVTVVLLMCWAGTSQAVDLVNENFDSMGPSGTALPAGWTVATLGSGMSRVAMSPYGANGAALTAWSPIMVLGALGGDATTNGGASSNIAHVYNCGLVGDADRAIGNYPRTEPTSGKGDHVVQVAFTNTVGAPITLLHVEYDMEQWGQVQGASSSGPEEVRLLFSSTSDTSGFTYMGTSFDGVAPKQAGAAGYPIINGNLPANMVHISQDFTLPGEVPAGAGMWLRFHDWNDNGTADHVLAIDNVLVTATPEPATMSLLALGALAMLRRRRK